MSGTVRPLRALLAITEGRASGGAQQVVAALLEKLPTYGVEPVLAVGESGALTQECRDLGHRAYVLSDLRRPINPVRDRRAYMSFRSVLESESPDVLHGHSFKAGALVRIAGRRGRIPAVYTMHGWGAYYELPYPLRNAWLELERRLSARSEVAYVCDEDRSQGSKAGIEGGTVIPVGPLERGETRTEPLLPCLGEPLEILIVARFAPQKDPVGTIRTLAAVQSKEPSLPWSVTWVGDGPLREQTVAEATRLGLSNRVHLAGATSDVAPFYQRSHMLLLLSRYEGTPLSIIEAMRARMIIVSAAVGGVEEMLRGGAGVLIPREASLEERASLVLKTLRGAQSLTPMREAAGNRSSLYDPGIMARRYADLYRKCAQGAVRQP